MTTIISLRCFLLLSVVVAVVHSCTVRGGSNFNNNIRISNGNIICDGTDACNNATISGCTTVTCADRDCTSATILDAETVNCEGINACYLATIGTATNPAGSVYCKGDEFTCYQSTIYANDTIVCGVDDGATAGDASEGSQNGACGFATLETPCLQCLGSNHGCDEACRLNGEDCPVWRYAGETCNSVCPETEECPVNEIPVYEDSGPATGLWVATTVVMMVTYMSFV